ncbi:hypothetical protein GQ44DRAFT_652357 [Phaeosphaeriaceae sp. PMI808]|nr:hypothetical protein GQ44DRAFT_652357 [Phaeosphaeriaceae sp. PMI808]
MTDRVPLESGYRWATVTPDDRSGAVYIVTFLGFTYSGLAFITRCFIKWNVLGLDDVATLLAQIASLVQFSLLLLSLSAGLAKSFDLLSENEYTKMAALQYGNQIALYICLGVSKVATVLLVKRLFTRDMRKAWIICNAFTGAAIAWTIAAALLVSVGCSPESTAPIVPSRTCPTIVARYKVVVITDALTDIALVIIPGYLCWQLQMSVYLKIQVLTVFAFRLPLIALSGLVFKTWVSSLSAGNPGIHRTSAIIYQQVELCLSLMAATIPCLKSFIRSFDTGSGVKANFGTSSNDHNSGYHTGSDSHTHGQSYQLSSIDQRKGDTTRSESDWKEDDGTVRVNPRPFTTSRTNSILVLNKKLRDTFEAEDTQELDRHSHSSGKELFIRREVEWEVTSEDAVKGEELNPGMLRLPQ